MTKGLILLILFTTFSELHGQASDIYDRSFTDVDQFVLNFDDSGIESIEELALRLTRPFGEDYQKARAIFTWIAHNIEYDTDERLNRQTDSHYPEMVLYRRSAQCHGYASLFKAMATYAGLEAEIIQGHSKGYYYSGIEDPTFNINHAWNAVKIKDEWMLLDVTWGAGYLHDETGVFVQRFEDHYFLTKPEHFVIDHFPTDSSWQLLDNPLAFDEYIGLIWKRPAFFRHKLGIYSHTNTIIETKGNERVLLRVPNNQIISARLMREGRSYSVNHLLVQHEDEFATIEIVPPARGTYDLEIFAREQADSYSPFNHVVSYSIVSNREITDTGFPETFGRFIVEKARLISPKNFLLETDTSVAFNLVVPGASSVSVINDGEWHDLSKSDSSFSGEIKVKEGKLQVAARFQDEDNYSVLLEYLVK